MSDNLQKKGPQDRTKINIHEPWEVAYWCRELGCDKYQLAAAVKAVGVSVTAVRKHLRQ